VIRSSRLQASPGSRRTRHESHSAIEPRRDRAALLFKPFLAVAAIAFHGRL
jgi:hypothetical protein